MKSKHRTTLALIPLLLVLIGCRTALPVSQRPLVAVAPVVVIPQAADAPSDLDQALTTLIINRLVEQERHLVLNDPATERMLGDDVELGTMWFHEAARIAAETTDNARHRIVAEVIECEKNEVNPLFTWPWNDPIKRTEWFFAVQLRIQNLESGQYTASEILNARVKRPNDERSPQWDSNATMMHVMHDTPLGEAIEDVLDQFEDAVNIAIPIRPWIPMVVEAGEDSLVINGGRNQDVKPGMSFTVFRRSHELRDPQTGRLLGVSVEDPITQVTVTDVAERYSTCTIPRGLRAERGMVLRQVEVPQQ